jgi:4-carboxymuconolactone decarboxylase
VAAQDAAHQLATVMGLDTRLRYGQRMSRLPHLRRDQLTPEGQVLWDAIAGVQIAGIDRSRLVQEDGSLTGPFNAWVHAPDTGKALLALGGTLLGRTSIERRLIEIAILTVGARWQAEFEWAEHSQMALDHGVPDVVVNAIGSGEDPPFEAADERVVHVVASQLARTGRVDTDAYRAARELLGDKGMVELVTLCGAYTMISFQLNAFDVPLPPGAVPRWGNSPQDGAFRNVGAAPSV